tara:strand:+ start:186 stop:1220 length:1035 start_codon:yes stop_codon:yes gene_type:complete
MNINLTYIFKDSRKMINTWKSRYQQSEYPKKVVMNIFYRKYTIQKMWDFLMSGDYKYLPKTMSKVQVVVDASGNTIRQLPKDNPDYGFIKLEQSRIMIDTNNFVNIKRFSTLIRGKIKELEQTGLQHVREIDGKIYVIEQVTPFNVENPDYDLKYDSITNNVCVTPEGGPIYSKTFYSHDENVSDTLVPHNNIEDKTEDELNSLSKLDWKSCHENLKYIYELISKEDILPLLENKLYSNEKVSTIKYSDFTDYIKSASKGNKDAIKGIEYTYFLNRIFDELILIWASMLRAGETKINAIAKITNAVIAADMTINDYSTIEKVFDQLGAERYLQSLFIKEIQNKL